MIKLLFIILFGYQSQDINLVWSLNGKQQQYILLENFNYKAEGSSEVYSSELNGEGFKLDHYQKRHTLPKAEFLIWFYLLKSEREQRIQQQQQKEFEAISKNL